MKIFGWAADNDGCGFYRVRLPLGQLAGRGHSVRVSERMSNRWRDDADVIVGQRVCLPGPSSRWQELAKEGRARLVYEVDDDLWNVPQSSVHARHFFGQPDIRANLAKNIAVADLVTTTNEYLADALRKMNPNVAVLPNCVPGWLLNEPSPNAEPEHDGPVTIGWGGSTTHELDWRDPGRDVARFVSREPSTQMHLIGYRPEDLWSRLPSDRRRFTGWIHGVENLYRGIDFNIGVAPLKQHLFNRSKSPIKALEYAALGIPVVASDYGPYAGFVRHGETGFKVTYPHEWTRALKTLLDPAARFEMGQKARWLAAEYTIENNVHRWESALCGIL